MHAASLEQIQSSIAHTFTGYLLHNHCNYLTYRL